MDEDLRHIFFEKQKIDHIKSLIRFPDSLDVRVKGTTIDAFRNVSNAFISSASEIKVCFKWGDDDDDSSSYSDTIRLNGDIGGNSTQNLEHELFTPIGVIRARHDHTHCLNRVSIQRNVDANRERISHTCDKIVAIHYSNGRFFVFYISGVNLKMFECIITDSNRLLPVDNHLFNKIVMSGVGVHMTTVQVSTIGNGDHLLVHHWREIDETDNAKQTPDGNAAIITLIPESRIFRVMNADDVSCWCESGGSGVYFIRNGVLSFINPESGYTRQNMFTFNRDWFPGIEYDRMSMCRISWDGVTDEIILCCGYTSVIFTSDQHGNIFSGPSLLMVLSDGDLLFASRDRDSATSALCVVDTMHDTFDIAFLFHDSSKLLALAQLYPMMLVDEQ